MPTHVDLRGLDDVLQIAERPTLFLSASVPKLRPPASLLTPEEQHENAALAADPRPREIRAAVIALIRQCFARDLRLVFGAHPAISPMVLSAAHEAAVAPDSVLIFQSDHFWGSIPDSTIALANWRAGRLYRTPRAFPPPSGVPARDEELAKRASLALMREWMVQVPGVCAAVFIGGIDGVLDESRVFAHHHATLPRFTVASTGGAAARLLQDEGNAVRGPKYDPVPLAILEQEEAYSIVMAEILRRV